MKIAKDGWYLIFLGLGVVGAAVYLHRYIGSAACALGSAGMMFSAFCMYFFRDPDRVLPQDSNKIYSPGDGTVLSVASEDAEGKTIRIFLSIFDVHVQRLPCAGKVSRVEYKPGTFVAAMKEGARANERTIVDIEADGHGKTVSVEQIAGLIARRIRCWINQGDVAVAGERYGLIQFGSQAAVHLPEGARPLVGPGHKVIGGITEIAEWIAES